LPPSRFYSSDSVVRARALNVPNDAMIFREETFGPVARRVANPPSDWLESRTKRWRCVMAGLGPL
jgi:hypothetical protein